MNPADRDAFCVKHNLPGWCLFSPGEIAQVQTAHQMMQAEIAAWRKVALKAHGAKTPSLLARTAETHQRCAKAMRAYRNGLLDVIERTTEAGVKQIAQEAVNT